MRLLVSLGKEQGAHTALWRTGHIKFISDKGRYIWTKDVLRRSAHSDVAEVGRDGEDDAIGGLWRYAILGGEFGKEPAQFTAHGLFSKVCKNGCAAYTG